MAAVVSIARGYDASPRSRRSVPPEGPVITREREEGYYLSAVEKDSRLCAHADAAGG